MKKNIFLVLLMPVAIIVAASILNSNAPVPTTNMESSVYASSIGYHSMVCVYKNGEQVSCKPNLFTNLGKNMTRDLLIHALNAPTNISVIAIANYTGSGQAQGDRNLVGEYGLLGNQSCGLTNGTGTITPDALVGVSGNWSISKTFTSTCNSVTVNATGLFNQTTTSSTTNYLFAQANFTSVTLQSADQINVTWYIWVE